MNTKATNMKSQLPPYYRTSTSIRTCSLFCFNPKFISSLTLSSSSPTKKKKMKKGGGGGVVRDDFCFDQDTQLTVSKTSLFFIGDGFCVYDPKGILLFRVDSYGPDSHHKDEIVLMDATGNCLLTVHKKRPSFHHRWEGFLGEKSEGQNPIFSVRRSSMIKRCSITIEMYENASEEYQIEGSFAQRMCMFYKLNSQNPNSERKVVAEIKRKVDATTNVMLGKGVFSLCLKPSFDAAFAMGLVLVLDQICGDYVDDENEVVVVEGVLCLCDDTDDYRGF